jgi:hypothetical protein
LRKLHNEELNDLYSAPNITWVIKSPRMRWARHVERTNERRCVYSVLVGKPEGRKPLGSWEDNIKWISNNWTRGSMDFNDLPLNGDTRRAPVNAPRTFGFREMFIKKDSAPWSK